MRSSNHRGNVIRRTFAMSLALLASAGCAGAQLPAGGPADTPLNQRIGVQLYTVRDQLQKDFEGTLRQVAALGYDEVEFAGYYDRSPQQVRALLDELGLRAPSSHIPIQALRADLDRVVRDAATVGHQYITVPYLAEEERSEAGYRRLAADLNRAGAAARAQGLRVAYHNHDFEFQPLPGGRSGMDILLAETDPALVDFELDLFWTVKAGHDPVALIQQHPGRFTMLHVKDMADRAGAQRMVAVGEGEIDFRRILEAAQRQGLRHFFVEHDRPENSLASIGTSYRNLHRMLP